MGRVPKPLTIWLTEPELAKWDVFKKMAEQGHTLVIVAGPTPDAPDIIFGKRAHLLLPGMEKFVAVAVKEARTRVFGGSDDGT